MARIVRQRIHEQVVQHLKQYIVERSLQPGDQLPTEVALARELGIGRQAVREGLRVLEGFGIVECKPRTGTRVSVPGMAAVAEHLQFSLDVQGVTVQEMWRARRAIECGVIDEVVEKADAEDFALMECAIQRGKANRSQGKSVAEADLAFHMAVLSATHNRALEGLGTILYEFFCKIRSQRVAAMGGEKYSSMEEHEAICQALRSRNAALARQLMSEHLGVYADLDVELAPATESPASQAGNGSAAREHLTSE